MIRVAHDDVVQHVTLHQLPCANEIARHLYVGFRWYRRCSLHSAQLQAHLGKATQARSTVISEDQSGRWETNVLFC